jgi:hypothetical protein
MINLKKGLIKFLAALKRKPKDPKAVWPDSKYVIKFAFRAGNIDYYCFDDLINLPYERAFCAMDFYKELDMNCDRKYLQLHYSAIEKLLRRNPVDIFAINALNNQMKERVEFIRSPNLIYKMASVVYFDKNESPIVYDAKYNINKIIHWKECFPGGSFFLLKPIQSFIPFLQESQMNLEHYQKIWDGMEKVHLENLSSHISGMVLQPEKSRVEE